MIGYVDNMLQMPGPQFLVFYLLVFLICWVGAVVWRMTYANALGTLIGFFVFEGVGVGKLVSAMARGKQNFQLLLMMMVVGGVVIFAKYFGGESSNGGGSCGSNCSSAISGGGSCGGGGCGGGGCGGCGG